MLPNFKALPYTLRIWWTQPNTRTTPTDLTRDSFCGGGGQNDSSEFLFGIWGWQLVEQTLSIPIILLSLVFFFAGKWCNNQKIQPRCPCVSLLGDLLCESSCLLFLPPLSPWHSLVALHQTEAPLLPAYFLLCPPPWKRCVDVGIHTTPTDLTRDSFWGGQNSSEFLFEIWGWQLVEETLSISIVLLSRIFFFCFLLENDAWYVVEGTRCGIMSLSEVHPFTWKWCDVYVHPFVPPHPTCVQSDPFWNEHTRSHWQLSLTTSKGYPGKSPFPFFWNINCLLINVHCNHGGLGPTPFLKAPLRAFVCLIRKKLKYFWSYISNGNPENA